MIKKISSQPIAPRLSGALEGATQDDLVDRHWTRLEIEADLSGAELLGATIQECRIFRSRLTGVDLSRARLVDVELVDCELSGAVLSECVLTRVSMRNCRLSGAVLANAKLRDVRVTECTADQMTMRMATVDRLVFEHTKLHGSDFTGTNFQSTRMFDCDLSAAEFSQATFSNARFHGSDFSDVRGILHLRGIAIDPDQMDVFALSLLAANGVSVEREREVD